MSRYINLYTDGSSLGNPGHGGYGGVIVRPKAPNEEFSGSEPNTTNNRMELLAVIEGLNKIAEGSNVVVTSDSTYVVKGITQWLKGWIKRDYLGVKNVDLWKAYRQAADRHNKIKAKWVRGHDGHPMNERCDTLAVEAAERLRDGR